MESYKQVLLDEIPAFREKGHKFLEKEMSKMDFKHATGGMGVYAQRDGQSFMIRLRVASGILNLEQLKLVQYFSHKIYKLLSFVASLKYIDISALTLSKLILVLPLPHVSALDVIVSPSI